MMGYWMVESGRLNRIEHLWAYESFDERDACRAGLVKDARVDAGFRAQGLQVDVVAQENRFMALDEKHREAFDRAVDARARPIIPDQPEGSAHVRRRLMALTWHKPVSPRELVVAGFYRSVRRGNPGSFVTLSVGQLRRRLCRPGTGIRQPRISATAQPFAPQAIERPS